MYTKPENESTIPPLASDKNLTLDWPIRAFVGKGIKDTSYQAMTVADGRTRRAVASYGDLLQALGTFTPTVEKGGRCIIPTSMHKDGMARVFSSGVENWGMFFDLDNGRVSLDEAVALMEAAGIGGFVYHTYSNGTRTSGVDVSKISKYCKDNEIAYDEADPEVLLAAVKVYFATPVKNYAPALIETFSRAWRTGTDIKVEHAPLEKLRVFLILDEAFPFNAPNTTPDGQKKKWARLYKCVAEKLGLGIAIDPVCLDIMRLMFLLFCPMDAKPGMHRSAVVEGSLLRLPELPPEEVAAIAPKVKKEKVAAEKKPATGDKVPKATKLWAATAGRRFGAVEYAKTRLEVIKEKPDGTIACKCPEAGLHDSKSPDDSSFWVKGDGTGPWTFMCHHNSCTGQHTQEGKDKADKLLWLHTIMVANGESLADLAQYCNPEDVAEAGRWICKGTSTEKKKDEARNVITALRMAKIDVSYEKFEDVKRLHGYYNEPVRRLEAGDRDTIAMLCAREHNFEPTDSAVKRALSEMARINTVDACRQYFDNIDAKTNPELLETWIIRGLGADDTPINREFSRVTALQIVARALAGENGVKADSVTILEGQTGIGKSSFLKALAPFPKWFADDGSAKYDSKEILERTGGILIWEYQEFIGVRFADEDQMKKVFSTAIDKARLSYREEETRRARRFTAVITTNKSGYLKDPTGNRRYLPILCHGVIPMGNIKVADLKWTADNRVALFAAAKAALAAGEKPEVRPDLWASAAEVQATRMQADGYFDRCEQMCGSVAGAIEKEKVRTQCNLSTSRSDYSSGCAAINRAMEALGYEEGQITKDNGQRVRVYQRAPAGWTMADHRRHYVGPFGATMKLPEMEIEYLENNIVAVVGGIMVDEKGYATGPFKIDDRGTAPSDEEAALGTEGFLRWKAREAEKEAEKRATAVTAAEKRAADSEGKVVPIKPHTKGLLNMLNYAGEGEEGPAA